MTEGEGCSWCTSKGERREAEGGAVASSGALLNGTMGGRGKEGPGSVSVWRREKEGEGGLTCWRVARGGRQRPPAVGRGRRCAALTGGTVPGSNGFNIIQI
jgi:hypothetical protein